MRGQEKALFQRWRSDTRRVNSVHAFRVSSTSFAELVSVSAQLVGLRVRGIRRRKFITCLELGINDRVRNV